MSKLLVPDEVSGVIAFDNLHLGGVPLATYPVGALRSFFLGAGSHILALGECDQAECTLFRDLYLGDPAASPSSELLTAVGRRMLTRVQTDGFRPSPSPKTSLWDSATALEMGNRDWRLQISPVVIQGQVQPMAPSSSEVVVVESSQDQSSVPSSSLPEVS